MRVFLDVHINHLRWAGTAFLYFRSFSIRRALEKILGRGLGGMTLRDRRLATFDLFLQTRNARFQLMGGKRGNILAQLDLG